MFGGQQPLLGKVPEDLKLTFIIIRSREMVILPMGRG